MTRDDIAAIDAEHWDDHANGDYGVRAHLHRGQLLAEVRRLRVEVEALRAARDAAIGAMLERRL